jgi:O-antigen biosynthesis protein
VNHLTLFKRERLHALGLEARSEFDGSQDYDLLLRYCRDLPRGAAVHMPYPAYLWRRTGKTYSATHIDAATLRARTAISEVYGAPVSPALVPTLHRLDFRTDPSALVSVIIPSKDHHALIARTLHGLLRETSHTSIDVQVVDNGSTDPEVLALYEGLRSKDRRFSAHIDPQPFNFARQVNNALSKTKAPYVLLLNNDIEVLEPGWLTEMLSCFAFPDVGIVGARLLYPDRTLQHVGVGVGLGGLAGHPYLGKPSTYFGEMNRLALRQTVSAVTGACMLISRACRERVGLLDQQRFAIAYNDVDYCLRAGEAGFRTVFTPFATLIHHESASRGSDEKPETIERFRREQVALAERHATFSFRDPARSPWYSRATSQPTFQPLSKLPASS